MADGVVDSSTTATTLRPMGRRAVRRAITTVFESDNGQLVMVLVDGTSLYAWLPLQKNIILVGKQAGRRAAAEGRCLSAEGVLVDVEERRVTVPYALIAGITTVDFRDVSVEPSIEAQRYDLSATALALRTTIESADDHLFPIEKMTYQYVVRATGTAPSFGGIALGYDTALYCDWDTLSRRSRGIRSLGFSTPVGGGSAGWDRSLWKAFRKTVGKSPTDMSGLCHMTNDAVVVGYASFLDFDSLPPDQRAAYMVESEGDQWRPAFIGSRDSEGGDPIAPWCYVLLKTRGFILPWRMWERFRSPIRISGDIVHMQVDTQFGRAQCFLRARSAAHLAEDEP